MPEMLSLVLGLVVGVVVTWLLVTLMLRSSFQGQVADQKARAYAAEQLVAELRQQAEQKDTEATGLREALQKEQQASTEAQTRLEAAHQSMQEQKKLLDEAGVRLADAFKALSADALRANNQSFLELAKQSLETVLSEARGDIGKRQEAIDALIQPLRDVLKQYDDQLRQFASKLGLKVPVLRDPQTTAYAEVGDGSLPTQVVIGRDGRIVGSPQVGFSNRASFLSEASRVIEKLL